MPRRTPHHGSSPERMMHHGAWRVLLLLLCGLVLSHTVATASLATSDPGSSAKLWAAAGPASSPASVRSDPPDLAKHRPAPALELFGGSVGHSAPLRPEQQISWSRAHSAPVLVGCSTHFDARAPPLV
jgi:hypothetical protein